MRVGEGKAIRFYSKAVKSVCLEIFLYPQLDSANEVNPVHGLPTECTCYGRSLFQPPLPPPLSPEVNRPRLDIMFTSRL